MILGARVPSMKVPPVVCMWDMMSRVAGAAGRRVLPKDAVPAEARDALLHRTLIA